MASIKVGNARAIASPSGGVAANGRRERRCRAGVAPAGVPADARAHDISRDSDRAPERPAPLAWGAWRKAEAGGGKGGSGQGNRTKNGAAPAGPIAPPAAVQPPTIGRAPGTAPMRVLRVVFRLSGV